MKSITARMMLGLLFAALVAPLGAFAQQPVVIKAVTAWPKNFAQPEMFLQWIERVNERGKGKVRIDYVGGPEVFPTFEQLEPLKQGVFGVLFTSPGYIGGALPELNATWFGFGATPEEMRKAGLVSTLDKVTREKAGIVTLGLPLQARFNLYLKKPIKAADLSGLRIRTVPVYDPVLRGLGAATVTVPPSEIVTALDTGVVDGFAWPAMSVVSPGYAAAIKYRVMPFWWVGTDVALMNAKTFDSLPAEAQKILVDTMTELERDVASHYRKKEETEAQALAKLGVQDITLGDDELIKVRRLHWEGGTESLLLKPSPQFGPAIKEALGQFAPK